MNNKQCSDYANAGKSGGVNNQGKTLTARNDKPASISKAANVPVKGVSNGGK